MSMEKKATRVAYGEYIAKLGDTNDKLVVLDADLAGATMTQYFKKVLKNMCLKSMTQHFIISFLL